MKAFILAAGRGERLRPHTDITPKPLLPVADRPLIVHHLEALSRAGIEDVVINTGWLGDLIPSALGNGSRWGLRIQYSPEGWPALETGGGIRRALPLLGDAPFWLINGDVLTDYQPDANASLPSGCLARLVMVENPEHNSKGDFAVARTESGIALIADGPERLTYSGIAILHPRLFDTTADGAFPLAPLLRAAIAQNAVQGSYHSGFWSDVGTPARWEAAQQWAEARVGSDV